MKNYRPEPDWTLKFKTTNDGHTVKKKPRVISVLGRDSNLGVGRPAGDPGAGVDFHANSVLRRRRKFRLRTLRARDARNAIWSASGNEGKKIPV